MNVLERVRLIDTNINGEMLMTPAQTSSSKVQRMVHQAKNFAGFSNPKLPQPDTKLLEGQTRDRDYAQIQGMVLWSVGIQESCANCTNAKQLPWALTLCRRLHLCTQDEENHATAQSEWSRLQIVQSLQLPCDCSLAHDACFVGQAAARQSGCLLMDPGV